MSDGRPSWEHVFPTVCPGCKNEVDYDICHCGDARRWHSEDHRFVPLGCDCKGAIDQAMLEQPPQD